MSKTRIEDGLRVVAEEEADGTEVPEEGADHPEEGADHPVLNGDGDRESLRDAFVEAFNARDLDEILGLVDPEVDCPDIRGGDGIDALREELEAIWERSPGAILTRGFLDGDPCAVGWLPDEEGCWSRAALVCFDDEEGLLTLVELPDDADALDRAEAEDPTGEELDEWADWAEWERGEETVPGERG